MATETSPYLEPVEPAARTGGWSGSDLAVGTSLVVLLIAPFLPWFSETTDVGAGPVPLSGTADGPGAHGFLWAVFALAVVGLAALVARDAIGRIPGNLPTARQMLVGATSLALVLTVLGIAVKPSGYAASGAVAFIPQVSGHMPVSVGWSYGGFVALVAAAVAFVAAIGFDGPLQSARGAAQAVLRRPGGAA